MKKLRIGIPLIQQELNGRTGWVAGLYFVKNCINALNTLPVEQVPDIFVFLPESMNEPLFNSVTQPSWLTLVHFSDETLNSAVHKDTVEQQINEYQCDVFLPLMSFPQFNLKGKTLGWIADFQEKHLPHFFSQDEMLYRKLLADFIMSYSEKALCISNDVLKDLKNHYPEYAEKGRVVYFRSVLPEESFSKKMEETLTHFNIHKKYIYMPNQFWVHKNHKLVFNVWKKLKDAGLNYSLICTGFKKDYRCPDYYDELQSYIDDNDLTEQIHLLGFVSREHQIQIYRGASALLQPSLFEGWNTSLEDAKALGKKIIVSDIPIHREQCEDNAVYFDPHSEDALFYTIKSLWDTLPHYDATQEKTARDQYQILIKAFAQDLIHLFHEVNEQKTSLSSDKYFLMGLPVFFLKHLRTREKDCAERLDLIQQQAKELEARLKVIHELDDAVTTFRRKFKTLEENKFVRLFARKVFTE